MRPTDPVKIEELRRWLTERLALHRALCAKRDVPIRWMRAFHLDYFAACGDALVERPRRNTAVRDVFQEFQTLFPEAPGGYIAFRRAMLQYRELRGVPVPLRPAKSALSYSA